MAPSPGVLITNLLQPRLGPLVASVIRECAAHENDGAPFWSAPVIISVTRMQHLFTTALVVVSGPVTVVMDNAIAHQRSIGSRIGTARGNVAAINLFEHRRARATISPTVRFLIVSGSGFITRRVIGLLAVDGADQLVGGVDRRSCARPPRSPASTTR